MTVAYIADDGKIIAVLGLGYNYRRYIGSYMYNLNFNSLVYLLFFL